MPRREPELWTPNTDHEYGNYVLKLFDKVNPVFYRAFLNKIGIKNIEKYIRLEKLKKMDNERY
jgi:hypothetical protein